MNVNFILSVAKEIIEQVFDENDDSGEVTRDIERITDAGTEGVQPIIPVYQSIVREYMHTHLRMITQKHSRSY